MESPRCKYANKFCPNERSRKANGSYHRFCDAHRTKANLSQRRWYARSRNGSLRRPSMRRSGWSDAVEMISPRRVASPSSQGNVKVETMKNYELQEDSIMSSVPLVLDDILWPLSVPVDTSTPFDEMPLPSDLVPLSEFIMDFGEIFVD